MSEPDLIVRRGGRPRRIWRSSLTGQLTRHMPIVRHMLSIVTCALTRHVWSGWQIVTEEGWFEYVDGPSAWAWRICRRCDVTEHCLPWESIRPREDDLHERQ